MPSYEASNRKTRNSRPFYLRLSQTYQMERYLGLLLALNPKPFSGAAGCGFAGLAAGDSRGPWLLAPVGLADFNPTSEVPLTALENPAAGGLVGGVQRQRGSFASWIVGGRTLPQALRPGLAWFTRTEQLEGAFCQRASAARAALGSPASSVALRTLSADASRRGSSGLISAAHGCTLPGRRRCERPARPKRCGATS